MVLRNKFGAAIARAFFNLNNILAWVYERTLESTLNGRPISGYLLDILWSSASLILWVIVIIYVEYIPRSGYILSKVLLRLDNYLFNTSTSIIGPVTFIIALNCISWLLYQIFYSKRLIIKRILSRNLSGKQASGNNSMEKFNMHHLGGFPSREDSFWKPKHSWHSVPPVLIACSWFLLNILYDLKGPISSAKNLAAWIFYVILHFSVPFFVGGWLYFFQPPGALSIYVKSVGLQNILISLIHQIIPSAPPLYIKLYGENKDPSYDMIYADGITRLDMKFGGKIYRAVYYASPHKFASLPSIHAAMSSLVFFFVCYYSNWTTFKLVAVIYLVGQWWSSIYLDHNYRIDMLVGLICATVIFTFFSWKINGFSKIHAKFIQGRLSSDRTSGSTMGMRVFRDTKLQDYFDPLS